MQPFAKRQTIESRSTGQSAKGKIERFFRRFRDQFLVRKLDLSSLAELNRRFTHWGEHNYNATEHSTLGMKPIDRFGVDLAPMSVMIVQLGPPSKYFEGHFRSSARPAASCGRR